MLQSINKVWLENFFESGAFLRKGNGQTFLWLGPWQKNNNKQVNTSSSNVSGSGKISLQSFFSSHEDMYEAATAGVQISAVDLQKLLSKHFPDIKSSIAPQDFQSARKDNFEESYRSIQGKIQRQEIEKAVPCVFCRTEKKPEPSDKVFWLQNLLSAQEGLHAYGFWNSEFGIMGATPELLFERDGNIIHSMALAGTMFRSVESDPQKLLKSTKDVHEHLLVVDDIEKQLSQLGWVKKGEMQVLQLPTLFHLMTLFEAEVGAKTDAELIRLLHPTPALGIHPRAFGFHWLEQLPEQKDRGLFGAPLLFQHGKKQSTCLVAIRNIQWGGYGSKIGAGCGIVQQSQLEPEWNEIQNKLDSIYKLLGMK